MPFIPDDEYVEIQMALRKGLVGVQNAMALVSQVGPQAKAYRDIAATAVDIELAPGQFNVGELVIYEIQADGSEKEVGRGATLRDAVDVALQKP